MTICVPHNPSSEIRLARNLFQPHWSHLLDLVEAAEAQILPVKSFGLSNQAFRVKCCFISSVSTSCNNQHDQIWGEIEALQRKRRTIFKIVTLTNVSGIPSEGNTSIVDTKS